MIAIPLFRHALLGAALATASPCAASQVPEVPAKPAPADAPAASTVAAAKAPKIRLRFSNPIPGRSYTVTLQEGASFVGETSPPGHVEKSADRLTFTLPESPKGSDAPEIEETTIESDVEISARTVTYQVELSGRTSVEIDLLGEVQVQGRPLQRNGVDFTFELPIPEIPKGWVLHAPPCPDDPATGRRRATAEHAGWSACRPEEPR